LASALFWAEIAQLAVASALANSDQKAAMAINSKTLLMIIYGLAFLY
jgi:hypothetical protein